MDGDRDGPGCALRTRCAHLGPAELVAPKRNVHETVLPRRDLFEPGSVDPELDRVAR